MGLLTSRSTASGEAPGALMPGICATPLALTQTDPPLLSKTDPARAKQLMVKGWEEAKGRGKAEGVDGAQPPQVVWVGWSPASIIERCTDRCRWLS